VKADRQPICPSGQLSTKGPSSMGLLLRVLACKLFDKDLQIFVPERQRFNNDDFHCLKAHPKLFCAIK
jgi:hypothetical protein